MFFKMCRCCQSCWEDFYWNCIEEKFCYDESIANYNPEEDDYYTKNSNGFLSTDTKQENNNSPVCIQPGNSRLQRNISQSAKIHEDDYRQIATNGPMLAPEILAVFANSQIFHDHQPLKKAVSPSVHGKSPLENDSNKLLKRLEGDGTSSAIKFTIEAPSSSSGSSLGASKQFPSIPEVDDEQDEIVLRPRASDDVQVFRSPLLNKRLRSVQSVPYFSFRPASENDIFTISGTNSNSIGQISMTPEIPSISYSTLPKNYEDTPTIEKYKESVSLYSIQTANSVRDSEFDFSMPRYFGKSDIIAQSADNLTSPKSSGFQSGAQAKRVEKSKRLKLLRTSLPPLTIHLGKSNKDKGIE
ncbi:uncharacterized protein LOC119082515 [Bradysia coprophila]|uniref:uncharacterized protein LOC119082183 n=1 Tax=Bradysia coprophila TaxID=38358 RepID=UPI00187DC47A|nr:uncharacterized protein LOC119082183 [Bradysia coprophila]XP_037047496.1 uncharacterized protein LOC119082183 [Bradysia coprophila]XP_037047497.1 uncharacterized protein LOC119082183 [Bradysia coprophila]XP_037047498.1 uncharacterized protein LOC119082183 [Bradysia coprophila]XP_037047499.1 uncharacterized protein LOC119082183 [Bradysia coprophila]XP_037047500.1 uncharacterized protein LOC119082183 [Bradysia coprophila]XP_037047922.1 uncharacterized protein LOC119082515 [Bradysia coprophil